MSKIDDQTVPAALARHLQPGEQLRHYAYGVKLPNFGLILLLYLTIGGALAVALLTKHYVVGLTDRRILVVSVKPGFFTRCHLDKVVEVFDFPLGQLSQMKVKTSTGALFTHMRVEGPGRTWVAKFHRMGMSRNRDQAMAIASALEQSPAAVQGAPVAPQLNAPPGYAPPYAPVPGAAAPPGAAHGQQPGLGAPQAAPHGAYGPGAPHAAQAAYAQPPAQPAPGAPPGAPPAYGQSAYGQPPPQPAYGQPSYGQPAQPPAQPLKAGSGQAMQQPPGFGGPVQGAPGYGGYPGGHQGSGGQGGGQGPFGAR